LETHDCILPQSLETQAFDDTRCSIVTRVLIVDQILEISLMDVLLKDKVVQLVEGQAFDKAILEHDVTPRYKFYVSLISQRNSATSFFGLSLRSLPRQYSTPFFWSPGDLDLLKETM